MGRTSRMLGTIFLVMTASHYYSACENILLRFQRPYFRMEHRSAVALSISITVSVFLSAVLFDDYIYTLKLFRGGSGQQISLAFGSRSTIFSSILQISSVVKFYFISRLIFPDLVDFPSDLNFQLSFPSHPIQLYPQRSAQNCSSSKNSFLSFFLFS